MASEKREPVKIVMFAGIARNILLHWATPPFADLIQTLTFREGHRPEIRRQVRFEAEAGVFKASVMLRIGGGNQSKSVTTNA